MIFPAALYAFVTFALVRATPITKPDTVTALPSGANMQHLSRIQGESVASKPMAHASATGLLNYYGGPVLSNVIVQPLWYGNVAYKSNLQSFYAAVTKSAWFNVLNQYSSGTYTVGSGSAKTGITITHATNTSVTNVSDMLIAMVKSGTIKPTANTYYPIHFGPGITIGSSCQDFCAFHSTIDISSLKVVGVQYLYYGVIPDQGGDCVGGCGWDPSPVNNLFMVSSHELAEAVTDPAIGVCSWTVPPLAWYGSGDEVGDICNLQQTTTVGRDRKTYVVQKLYSNSANACVSA
ncbi:hypothetical protein HDU98_009115 [Podochytrium sp. JEL0797]|nr:hypothetical protein HDU98_009115 [Podochytrium sp. JEL0797]